LAPCRPCRPCRGAIDQKNLFGICEGHTHANISWDTVRDVVNIMVALKYEIAFIIFICFSSLRRFFNDTNHRNVFFFRIWELNRNDQKRLARLSKRMPKITVFCHWGFSPKTEMAGPVWAEDRTNITDPNTWRLLNWLLMTWGTCQQKCGWVLVFWALRTISCDTICLKTLKCRVRISRGFNAGTVKCGRILETHIRNSDFSRTQDFVLRETLFHFEIYEMPSCREKLIISTAVYAVFIRIDQSKCKSAALCDMTGLSIRLKVMDREITEPGRNWRCGHVACKTEASCPNRGSLCALL
jgi:hypothetical protein